VPRFFRFLPGVLTLIAIAAGLMPLPAAGQVRIKLDFDSSL
jgi:hypothetical protein